MPRHATKAGLKSGLRHFGSVYQPATSRVRSPAHPVVQPGAPCRPLRQAISPPCSLGWSMPCRMYMSSPFKTPRRWADMSTGRSSSSVVSESRDLSKHRSTARPYLRSPSKSTLRRNAQSCQSNPPRCISLSPTSPLNSVAAMGMRPYVRLFTSKSAAVIRCPYTAPIELAIPGGRQFACSWLTSLTVICSLVPQQIYRVRVPLLCTLDGEDVHRERRRLPLHHAAAVLREPDTRPGALTVAGLAAELREHLVDLGHARRADRVALGDQAAARVHRDRPVEVGGAGVDQLAALAGAVQPQLRRRRSVVQLDRAQVLRTDAGLLIRLLHDPLRDPGLAGGVVAARADAGGEDVDGLRRELPRLLGGAEDGRRRAVADGRAHQAGQGLRHRRRVEHVLQRVDRAVLGVRVQGAVVVVLDRDPPELLLRRPVALHVVPREGGVEVHEHGTLLAGALGWGRLAAALAVALGGRHRRLHLRRPLHVHRRAYGGERPALVLVVQLLEADGQGDVVHAGS